MPFSMRQHAAALALTIAAGCAGGDGCSGCACAGMEPLQSGFPVESRIENAGSIRLTDTGVTFLNDNLDNLVGGLLGGGSGVVEFEIPPTDGSQLSIDYFVCENGPNAAASPPECVMEIDVAGSGLVVATEPDHNIRISGPVPIRLQKLPMRIEYFCIPVLGCAESNLDLTITGNQACPGDTADYVGLDLDANISIEIDPDMSHVRYGYSRARVNVSIDEQTLSDSIRICGSVDAGILDSLLSLVGDLLIGEVTGLIDEQIEDALCEQANPMAALPCPEGTNDVDGVCRYGTSSDDDCVSTVLGVDGTLAMNALGGSGAFNLLLAAGGTSDRGDGFALGDLNPVAGGATVSLQGGVDPAPVSGCVPELPIVTPSGIPTPDELVSNTVSDWPTSTEGPHFGLALSERFLNYALAQVHQSGGLCLGIGPDTIPQLNSSLLQIGLGTPSMVELGLQKAAQPTAISIRPQTPPVVVMGDGTNIDTDPLLDITLDQMAFDFYVWSLDRYVRVMTATFDVHTTVNLDVTDGGLQPVVGDLTLANGVITNSEMLREDPALIAAALQDLVGGLVGDLLGDALPAIDLNDSLASTGLELVIPPTVDGQGSPGVRKLTKDSDQFLGIFAALGIPAVTVKSAETNVELLDLKVDPAAVVLSSWTRAETPSAHLRIDADGAHEVQYRLDNGPWHPFVQASELVVQEPWLRAQGRHQIEVRARRVGEPRSVDPTPQVIELMIDPQPPTVDLKEDGDRLLVTAWDVVTEAEDLQVRHRAETSEGLGAWSAWTPAPDLASIPIDGSVLRVELEARDENGNVGTVSQALIRGRASGGGCDCSVPGPKGPERDGRGLLAVALAALLGWRRRRR